MLRVAALLGAVVFGSNAVWSDPVITVTAPPSAEPVARNGAREERRPADKPACITYRAESVYRSGYEHRVHIQNACESDAECAVSTNVNPEPIQVDVPAGTLVTVLTARGSPSYTFKATVSCTLRA